MTLKELFGKAGVTYPFGEDIAFTTLCEDSRHIQSGDAFIAWTHDHIKDAHDRGAVVVLGPDQLTRAQQVALIGAYFHPLPAHIMAVTGTNGKTSVTHFVQQILNRMGIKSAALGTLGVIPDFPGILKPNLTTMPMVWIYSTLQKLARQGVQAVAMEASSHGLDQHRVDGLPFCGVALTNITHDHMDYHKTWEAYRAAKQRLFTDWPQATVVLPENEVDFAPHATWVYGGPECDVGVRDVQATTDGLAFELVGYGRHRLPLVGCFQLQNVLAALGLLQTMNIEMEDILPHLRELKPVPGRLEKVGAHNGAHVYVDYAHTPDGLQTVLQALRPHTAGQLYVVFGCGGDRDTTKRPMMGGVAQTWADHVIITDDNPRTEDPAMIRQAIHESCPKAQVIGGRQHALEVALAALNPGDVLVVAGKGDERTQEVGGVKHPFHDRSVLEDLIQQGLQ